MGVSQASFQAQWWTYRSWFVRFIPFHRHCYHRLRTNKNHNHNLNSETQLILVDILPVGSQLEVIVFNWKCLIYLNVLKKKKSSLSFCMLLAFLSRSPIIFQIVYYNLVNNLLVQIGLLFPEPCKRYWLYLKLFKKLFNFLCLMCQKYTVFWHNTDALHVP